MSVQKYKDTFDEAARVATRLDELQAEMETLIKGFSAEERAEGLAFVEMRWAQLTIEHLASRLSAN